MTPTPERALELAERMDSGPDGYTVPSTLEAAEIAAIIRAYADIAPKYQAVLDAEPVAFIEHHKAGDNLSWEAVSTGASRSSFSELIIKPTP